MRGKGPTDEAEGMIVDHWRELGSRGQAGGRASAGPQFRERSSVSTTGGGESMDENYVQPMASCHNSSVSFVSRFYVVSTILSRARSCVLCRFSICLCDAYSHK